MTDFDDFVTARSLALTRFAYLLCGDARMAEDLVRDALESADQPWRRRGVASHPEAYVRQGVIRAFVSRQGNTPAPATDAVARNVSDTGESTDLDGADEMWAALAQLSAAHRAILVLRYHEGLDDATIARLLRCSRSAVRSAAMRSLMALEARTSRERRLPWRR